MVVIRSDDGKEYTLTTRDQRQYDYYRIGDRVRHHGGLNSFEKYDKSRDTIIFCLACGSMNDMQSDVCTRCRCPLPK